MSKILAVDDESEILKIIKHALQKDGHEVTVISNPAQIPLDALGGYDLILLDVMMPGTDGFEICSKIRDIVEQIAKKHHGELVLTNGEKGAKVIFSIG